MNEPEPDLPPPPTRPRRLVFLGTPEMAVPPLQALVADGWPIDLVVTRADRRRRRNRPPEPSPVKAAALDLGLAVTDRLDDLDETGADLGVVVAYGRLIPTDLLARLPMVNLHFSLLPRGRGAAPVERAILAGDDQTGVCVMQILPELDAGPVYARASLPVGGDSLSALRSRLVERGTELLTGTLRDGLTEAAPQQGEVTYADKINPEDLHLDWSLPSVTLGRIVRLERAWTSFRGDRLLVLEVAPGDGDALEPGLLDGLTVGTGDGRLRLVRVQPAGRAAMTGEDWVNGARLSPGERLGGRDDDG